jgi:hypothetical protein
MGHARFSVRINQIKSSTPQNKFTNGVFSCWVVDSVNYEQVQLHWGTEW